MRAKEKKLASRPEGKLLNQVAIEISAKYKRGAPACSCCKMFRPDLIMEISQEAMRRWAKLATSKAVRG